MHRSSSVSLLLVLFASTSLSVMPPPPNPAPPPTPFADFQGGTKLRPTYTFDDPDKWYTINGPDKQWDGDPEYCTSANRPYCCARCDVGDDEEEVCVGPYGDNDNEGVGVGWHGALTYKTDNDCCGCECPPEYMEPNSPWNVCESAGKGLTPDLCGREDVTAVTDYDCKHWLTDLSEVAKELGSGITGDGSHMSSHQAGYTCDTKFSDMCPGNKVAPIGLKLTSTLAAVCGTPKGNPHGCVYTPPPSNDTAYQCKDGSGDSIRAVVIPVYEYLSGLVFDEERFQKLYPDQCDEIRPYHCIYWEHSEIVRQVCPATCGTCPDQVGETLSGVAGGATAATVAGSVAGNVATTVSAQTGASVGGAGGSGGFGGVLLILGHAQFISILGMVSAPFLNSGVLAQFASFKWASLQFPNLIPLEGTVSGASGAAVYLNGVGANARSLFWSSTVVQVILGLVIVGGHKLLVRVLGKEKSKSLPFPKFELVQFQAAYQGLTQSCLITFAAGSGAGGAEMACAAIELLLLNGFIVFIARRAHEAAKQGMILYDTKERSPANEVKKKGLQSWKGRFVRCFWSCKVHVPVETAVNSMADKEVFKNMQVYHGHWVTSEEKGHAFIAGYGELIEQYTYDNMYFYVWEFAEQTIRLILLIFVPGGVTMVGPVPLPLQLIAVNVFAGISLIVLCCRAPYRETNTNYAKVYGKVVEFFSFAMLSLAAALPAFGSAKPDIFVSLAMAANLAYIYSLLIISLKDLVLMVKEKRSKKKKDMPESARV